MSEPGLSYASVGGFAGAVVTYASPFTWVEGAAITPANPTVVSGTPVLYDAPGAPAGLAVNAGTGQITGTPTVAAVADSLFVVHVSSAAGEYDVVVSYQVQPVKYAGAPFAWTSGVPIAPELPTVVSGTPSAFSSVNLPAGIAIDAVTGELTGTPTVPDPGSTFTVHVVTDEGAWDLILNFSVA